METYYTFFKYSGNYKNGQQYSNNKTYTVIPSENIKNYTEHFNTPYLYYAIVTIPNVAVTIPNNETNTIVTNKIEIIDYQHIKELDLWNDNDFCEFMATTHKGSMKYIKVHTSKIHLLAVTKDGESLKYINDQTIELQTVAVNQNGMALQYVKNKTNEIQLLAIKNNPYAIQFSENPTNEMCLLAVNSAGYVLRFISPKYQTEEICIAAINNWPNAFQYVHNKTPLIIKKAIENFGHFIYEVEDVTPELILLAIKTCPHVLKFEKVKQLLTPELCMNIMELNYKCFQYIENQTYEMCNIALNQNVFQYIHIKSNTFKEQFSAIVIDKLMQKYKSYNNFVQKYRLYLGNNKTCTTKDQAKFMFSEFSLEELKIIIEQFNEIYNEVFNIISSMEYDNIKEFLLKYNIEYKDKENYFWSNSYNELEEEHYELIKSLVVSDLHLICGLLNGKLFDVEIINELIFDFLTINESGDVDFYDEDDEINNDDSLVEHHIVNGIECNKNRVNHCSSFVDLESFDTMWV